MQRDYIEICEEFAEECSGCLDSDVLPLEVIKKYNYQITQLLLLLTLYFCEFKIKNDISYDVFKNLREKIKNSQYNQFSVEVIIFFQEVLDDIIYHYNDDGSIDYLSYHNGSSILEGLWGEGHIEPETSDYHCYFDYSCMLLQVAIDSLNDAICNLWDVINWNMDEK